MINIKESLNNLTPCVMDGVTNDLQRLQAYHDYIVNNFEVETLYIPTGKLLINDTFKWRTDKVKIQCDGEIIADINDSEKFAIQVTTEQSSEEEYNEQAELPNVLPNSLPSGNPYVYYKNSRIEAKGLVIYPKNHLSCNGINFSVGNNDIGCSRLSLTNCVIHGFKTGVTIGTRAYMIKLTRCSIYECDIALYMEQAYDSGENIKINDCEIFHCRTAFKVDNIHSTLYVTGTSIDYITGRIIDLRQGRIFVDSSYFESYGFCFTPTNRPFVIQNVDGITLNISNSYIAFTHSLPATMDYVFENNYIDSPYSGIKLKDCFLQGCNTTTNMLSTGIIDISGTSTFQWDRIARISSIHNVRLNDPFVYNASLNAHPEFRIFEDREIYSWRNGLNTKIEAGFNTFGSEQHSVTFYKCGEENDFSSAGFVLPLDKVNSMVGFETEFKADKETWGIFKFGFCDYYDNKIFNEVIVLEEAKPLNQNISKFETNGALKNKWSKKYVFFRIDMYPTKKDTRIHLKNFRLTEI